jgi:hypothetical protein
MKIIQSSKESTMKRKLFAVIGILAMLVCLLSAPVFSASPASLPDNCTPAAGVVIQPLYSNGYVACALGTLKGLPAAIGAITFKDGDPNTLLVATYTETSPAAIYSVPVHRDADNHILDFSNSGTYFASAPYVSTGMAYGPENLLFYSRWPVNELGEIKPGSALTDKIIGLSALGVTPSLMIFQMRANSGSSPSKPATGTRRHFPLKAMAPTRSRQSQRKPGSHPTLKVLSTCRPHQARSPTTAQCWLENTITAPSAPIRWTPKATRYPLRGTFF